MHEDVRKEEAEKTENNKTKPRKIIVQHLFLAVYIDVMCLCAVYTSALIRELLMRLFYAIAILSMDELCHAKKSNYTRHLNVRIVGNYREMCK